MINTELCHTYTSMCQEPTDSVVMLRVRIKPGSVQYNAWPSLKTNNDYFQAADGKNYGQSLAPPKKVHGINNRIETIIVEIHNEKTYLGLLYDVNRSTTLATDNK